MLAAFLFLASLLPFSLQQMNPEIPVEMYDSAEHKGAVFVIENYFNTCPYCNDNAGNVDDLAEDYSSEPRVQVLDVGIDRTDSQYESWINKHRPNHPVLKDSNRSLTNKLGTTGYPTTYVVNCKGEVLYRTTGVWSASAKKKIRAAIDSGLSEQCD